MERPVTRRPGKARERPRREPPAAFARVAIESIAAGGEGVGRLPDGRAVFVHRTAPGDEAEIAITLSKERWARGTLRSLLVAGPDRRDAPCPYYDRCGGCTLEHLRYEAQLAAKAGIVGDALTRIGGVPTPPPEVVPSPRTERYRNRVSFTLRRSTSGGVVAGFHALADPDAIVDMDGGCLLPEEPIARVWDRLRATWGGGARRLPSGEQIRLTLRATAGGAVSLLVEGGSSPGEPEALLAEVEGLESIWHRSGSHGATLLAGAPSLEERWGEESVPLAGEAFLQVNREAAALLEDHLMSLALPVAGQRVVDAYCGVGLHARRLARAGASVVGIELDPHAVQAARQAGTPGARFLQGPVEDLIGEALPAALVILNPPRGGIAPEVADRLLERPPVRLIYVSCNPATLARDLRRLSPGFRLDGVRCFDLFPQTAHVETVASLSSILQPS